MPELNLNAVNVAAQKKIRPFFDDVLGRSEAGMHSIHVTGTAVTEDFDEKNSDVNSIVVLKKMDLKFLKILAPLGKKYSRQKVSAPLIMTPDYIQSSLDVFPIEFLNFCLIHTTVYGEDIFSGLHIDRMDLRHQCERELKAKLIWLRQGYLSSMGDRSMLSEGFVKAITGYIPLFRGIISLLGKEPPVGQEAVIAVLSDVSTVNTDVFSRVLKAKHENTKLSIDDLDTMFEDYYAATERLGMLVDEIKE